MNTRRRPRLTRADLKEIQERNPRVPGNQASDDLYAALWEIQRLRVLLLRANQLQTSLGPATGGGVGLILSAFRAELEGEPCIDEQPQLPRSPAGPRSHFGFEDDDN